MALNELRDLYVHELRDLYNAEKQITKALPKMIKAANHDELRSAFEEHLEVTREQMSRLEQIFEAMGERPSGPKCKGMEGLIEENKEMMEEDAEPSVCDAALIVGAQKVEHYEIAGYGSVRTFAEMLGETQAARLLERTQREEEETDRKLSEIARIVNEEAESGSEDDMEDEDVNMDMPARGRTGSSRGSSSRSRSRSKAGAGSRSRR
ncbi:MAG TPA: ferritin-like domain-containing protein [Candidatus Polarisedimenticolaceae bacterium]|nr:ferritin-like domain-containing protein [Candidatus Polarisedimenticolaceae bacterium]